MTTFGDGVYQYGGVPVGVNRLATLFQKDNIYFVDYDGGHAGAFGGLKPDEAVTLPSTAVGMASKEAIIYIRPRTSITSSDVYYSDNITCPVTKPHLQFIGCGAGTVPGYRGAAQIRPLVTTSNTFDIQGSGVCIENLFLNNYGADAASAPINSQRLGYSGAVCLQVRNCRLICDTTDSAGAIILKSCQYNIIEDNIFLDCVIGIQAEATSGSPQSYTIRRNIFEGLVLTRDCDINIVMTDINSRGHIIADNIFADGQPNSASARYKLFISTSAPITAVSTGIISGNHFSAVSGQTYSTTGTAVKVAAGWFLVGNYDADGFAA